MELTKKYGLYIALGKENVKEHRLKEPDKTKYEIYHTLKSAIPNAKNWNELKSVLLQSGITIEFRKNGNTDKIQGVRFGKNGYEFNGSKIDRSCSYSKINYQLQQNERLQRVQKHQPEQPVWQDTIEFSSIVESTTSALGGLFDILSLPPGHNENQEEVFRQEAKIRKKRKKGRQL